MLSSRSRRKDNIDIYEFLSKKKKQLDKITASLPLHQAMRMDALFKLIKTMTLDGHKFIPAKNVRSFFHNYENGDELISFLLKSAFIFEYDLPEVKYDFNPYKPVPNPGLILVEKKYYALFRPKSKPDEIKNRVLKASMIKSIDDFTMAYADLNAPLISKESFYQFGLDPTEVNSLFDELVREKKLIWTSAPDNRNSLTYNPNAPRSKKQLPLSISCSRRVIGKLTPMMMQIFIANYKKFIDQMNPLSVSAIMTTAELNPNPYFTDKDAISLARIIIDNPSVTARHNLETAKKVLIFSRYLTDYELDIQEQTRQIKAVQYFKNIANNVILNFLNNLTDFIRQDELIQFLAVKRNIPEMILRMAMKYKHPGIRVVELTFNGSHFYMASISQLLKIYDRNSKGSDPYNKINKFLSITALRELVYEHSTQKISESTLEKLIDLRISDLKTIIKDIDKPVHITYHDLASFLPASQSNKSGIRDKAKSVISSLTKISLKLKK